jgi:hypothetical protein
MATQAGGAQQAGAGVVTLARGGALSGRWSLDPQASRVEFRPAFLADDHRARLVRARVPSP